MSFKYWLFSAVFLFAYARTTYCANLRCYNGSLDNYTEISFNESLTLFDSACYQYERKTVVYTFGYGGKADGPSIQAVIGVYLDKANILLLNWEDEAKQSVAAVSYVTEAIPNAKTVGEDFGKVLLELSNGGLNLSDVHLIGFSLGAHLMASTAEELKKSNASVSRITGLDPAGPGLEGFIRFPIPTLGSYSADFVDVVHGNPGGYGTVDSVGTVDFWPNCGSSIQPACLDNSTIIDILTSSALCSHDFSWRYFVEAIKNSTTFAARYAESCTSWRLGAGTDEVIYMGDNVDMQARGNFYFRTSTTAPYGLGEEGTQPDPAV